MKRKVSALTLSFLILMSAIVTVDLSTAATSADTEGGFTYQLINGGSEAEITGYNGPDKALVIPSTIDGRQVTSIGDNAFYRSSIVSVVIPDSVTHAGSMSFYHCFSLASVDLGKGIVSIGDNAFYECVALTSVTIPDGVTSIGSYAFAYCSGLTSIALPDGLRSIESWTFARCTALTYISIPEGVTSIGWLAFNGCTALTSVDLGSGLKNIGTSAFNGCTALTSIEFPESVTTISTNAFRGCSALTTVEISDRLTRLDTYAFAECGSLTSIQVDEANPNYASVDGVLYNKGLTTLMQFPGGKSGKFTVPDGVVRIDNQAFAHSTALTEVTVGSKVTMIDKSAFWYCDALTAIHVDEANPNYASVDGVMYNQDRSELIQYPGGRSGPFTVPGTVTSIAEVSFAGSAALTSVTMPDDVIASIWNDAFRDCTALVSVDIGNGVTTIGSSAFLGCTALNSVKIGNGVAQIGANAFSACSSLTRVVMSDNVHVIGPGAFQSCSSLSSIVMGGHVEIISGWAFAGCTSLTTMIFTGNAPRVEEHWDQGCSELTVFYREGATGFSTSIWNSNPCYPLGPTPTAPNGFTVIPGSGSVSISWTAPSYAGDSDIDHYVVYQDGTEVKNVTGTEAIIDGLTNGATYMFKVAAHNADGVGQASKTVLVRTSAVTVLKPDTTYLHNSTVQLEWSYDGNIYDLDLFIVDVNGKRTDLPPNMRSYLLANLSDGTYAVKVIAMNMDGHAIHDETVFMVDTAAPYVMHRSPTGSSESTLAAASVVFSEAMDQGSVSITVDGVEGTLSWDENTAMLRPNSPLRGNTEHSVSVFGRDLAGNELEKTTWMFTTANVGSVSGTIKDEDGNPLPGSRVTLAIGPSSSGAVTTTTDAAGQYAFNDLPVGEYRLSIEKSGYMAITYDVKITPDTVAFGGTTVDGKLHASSWLESNTVIVVVAVAMISGAAGTALLARKRSTGGKMKK